MQYELTQQGIEFRYASTQLRSGFARHQLIQPAGISKSQLKAIGESIVQSARGLAPRTKAMHVHALSHIFIFFRERSESWPSAQEWPIAIFNLYCNVLLAETRSRTTDSSRQIWQRIRIVLLTLMSSNVIAESPLPNASLSPGSRSELTDGLTLGEAYEPVPPPPAEPGAILSKQYLVDLSYMKSGNDFFTSIESELRKVADATLNVCLEYWTTLKEGQAACRRLIDSIPREKLLAAVCDPANGCLPRVGAIHYTDLNTSHGMAYILAGIEYYFFEQRIPILTMEELKKIPFFSRLCRGARRREEFSRELRYILKAPYLHTSDLIARAIGLLSSRDCSVATAILMHQQPRFTVSSVEDADAYDKNGKLRILVTDASGESLFFSVAKNRAKSRKGGVLTKLASSVLVDVHHMTMRLRGRLATEQPALKTKLFLVVSKNGMGCAMAVGDFFSCKPNCVFDLFESRLMAAGMTKNTFTLGKIRNTQGILAWLATGSLISMAATMGNSVKVILSNYIPDWLYHRMLTNSTRRLQQKLVVMATATSRWQVSSSDFSDLETLQKFLMNVLATDVPGNALNDLFKRKFRSPQKDGYDGAIKGDGGTLYVSLEPVALAALEVYVKNASSSEFVLELEGEVVESEFKSLARLYQLLYAVVHSDATDENDAMLLDVMGGGSPEQLKLLWRQSRPLVAQFEGWIKKRH